jgi:hypothetical protein
MSANKQAPERMQISFFAALAGVSDPALGGPELLPTRLSIASAQVLPVAAAGISLIDDGLRVPLGASSSDAVAAERLQFTVGEGPCLSASAAAQPMIASQDTLADKWPFFFDSLITQTPYRSVASLPLTSDGSLPGAMDFYWTDPETAAQLPIEDATTIAGCVSLTLIRAPLAESPYGIAQPAWLSGPVAQHRLDVWKAIGLIGTAQALDPADALSVLRGFAYAQGEPLDQIAEDLVSGRLTPERLLYQL